MIGIEPWLATCKASTVAISPAQRMTEFRGLNFYDTQFSYLLGDLDSFSPQGTYSP